MKTILFLCLALAFAGCGPERTWWVVDYVPMTEAERKAVADEQSRILSGTPHVLSGHDQDWDDAIKAAHEAAIHSCCEPRLFEVREYSVKTGNWKPMPPASH